MKTHPHGLQNVFNEHVSYRRRHGMIWLYGRLFIPGFVTSLLANVGGYSNTFCAQFLL
jgi:hypothetical protein